MNTPNTTIPLLFRLYMHLLTWIILVWIFFLVLPRALFLMFCPLVSRRSEKWCAGWDPLDSEGWVSILQLAGHRRNMNSFNLNQADSVLPIIDINSGHGFSLLTENTSKSYALYPTSSCCCYSKSFQEHPCNYFIVLLLVNLSTNFKINMDCNKRWHVWADFLDKLHL